MNKCEEPQLNQENRVKFANNLTQFRQIDAFQAGIMSLISGLMTTQQELTNLDKMFKDMDKDNSGTLSLQEL